MNLKYFIVKGKKKYCSIYVRFWDSKRLDQKTRTGISTLISDWSESKQRIKVRVNSLNTDELNKKLDDLERFIYDSYNFDYNNKAFISKDWLKVKVESFFGRVSDDELYKAYFIDWVERFVATAHKRLNNGKPITANTIKNYTSTLTKLKDFEESQNTKYRFEDIDLNFHRDFIFFCREKYGLNNNSIGSLINRIKTFCRNIEFDGYQINPKYKHQEFSIPKNETFDIYLNENEIKQIFEYDFSCSEKLDNTRDLFVIGLVTGLRVSDFLKITKDNILGNVINITTTKTNQNLTIPIHPFFSETLKKRNGDFPRKISDQKFNKYIKEVTKEVGLKEKVFGSKRDEESKTKAEGYFEKWELVTSHTCRRSFATNLYLAGIDVAIIRKATGHTSEKTFINYVKASNDEHIKKISDYWKNKS
ncbi:tyrosine-type recombinase/integrase [Flavobacterium sp.]|uniref:tyrosine-type recombinase/integrase n=1 Tax=Flavobacterium sp. TaxID=239 RepID=UPI003528BE43